MQCCTRSRWDGENVEDSAEEAMKGDDRDGRIH